MQVGKKPLWVLLLGVMLASVLSAVPKVAYAAAKDPLASAKITDLKGTVTLYLSAKVGAKSSNFWYTCNPKKLTAISSSNTNVLTFLAKYNGNSLQLHAMNAGTSRLNFTYAGKKYSTKVIVKEYVRPVSKLTIGTTNLAPKFKKTSYYFIKINKLKNKKINVKPANGWKLLGIYAGSGTKTVKNGFRLPSKSLDGVTIILQNIKTKGVESIYILNEPSYE